MNMKKTTITIAAVFAAACSWGVQGTIYTDKTSQQGDIKWQPRAKSYIVSYKKGNTNVSSEFPHADVTELDIPKPDNLDRLVQAVRSGSAANAVAPLEAIVKEYRMLVWDKQAGRWLVEAYIEVGKAKKALDVAEDIIKDDPKSAYSGDLAPAYWQALLKLGKKDELEKNLKKAAASGSRAASAEALIVRGDMVIAAEGDNAAAHRKALTDGYLRVALMYNDPECKDARRTAMERCAASFEKLGMASRKEAMLAEIEKL